MAELRLAEIRKNRLEKVKKLRELGINPYPSKAKGNPGKISDALNSLDREAEVAGRLTGWREHGNVIFADLKDETGRIQLWFQKNALGDQFKILKLFDVGDFLYAKGKVVKTQAGEVSVDVADFQLLSKSIRPLPSTWHGVKDVEERYRKRYLDLLLNPGVRERFNTRTLVIKELRRYLDDLGFWEVETPTLQPLYGGANAKPFTTHHNALDHDFYLRIADELYLKRLIVGGYDKVYEICKDFRNEGLDQTHSPEFTMVEYYEAYADYQRVMDVTEGLFKHLADKVLGKMELEVGNQKIDISKSWPRVTMVDALRSHLNIDVMAMDEAALTRYCKDSKVELLGGETKGQLIFTIFEHKVTDNLIDPIWIYNYPKDVSPLSKANPVDVGWVERFEGYIGGKEICDGWSELTDPMEQRERFKGDVKMARKDREEAQQVDEDFIEAMEYGMPPLGGIGIGIDRLTMFFTNTWSIKEVILFPTLRPENLGVSFKQDFDHKLVVVIDRSLPSWQIMNTSAHAAAYLGNKMSEKFDTGKYFVTKDGVSLPRNSQYPIITLSATPEQLKKLILKVRESELLHIGYIPEMIKTTDDKKLAKMLADKTDSQVDYIGVGIFGRNDKVEALTKDLPLWE